MTRMTAVLMAVVALGGCATKQVNPVELRGEKRICVIENPRVMHDFLGAYRRALEERGFAVEVLPETARVDACPLTTAYTGQWRWDMVLYLAYAEMRVYRDGQQVGRAVHAARSSRFISAEGKIREMANDLFKS